MAVPSGKHGLACVAAAEPDACDSSAATFFNHCFDCPATRRKLLEGMIGADSSECQFSSLAIEAREPVPPRWFERYGLGFVRRGILIRQRVDHQGRATSVDVVGAGGAFPVEPTARDTAQTSVSAGYAVARTLVCVASNDAVTQALRTGGSAALDLHTVQNEAITRMERLADARARPTVASAVAALLCVLIDAVARNSADSAVIPTGFQQRDMASLLSVRHESVCRVMRDFGKRELVATDAAGTRIVDRKGLEML